MNPMHAEYSTELSSDTSLSLESVLCTEELTRRPSRLPDYQTENRALAALVQALADSPGTILQTFVDTVLEVFDAGTAGMSLLTTHDGGKRFNWPAIAGAWKPYVGEGTPRDFGPCGDALDRDAPLLFKHFERRYTYLKEVTPAAREALLIPFHVHGKAVGTLWVLAHDERRRFDAEDLRQLESLGRFASAAYQAVGLRQADDVRRAALNLMEDAVHARDAVEQLNAELRDSERRFREMIEALPAAVYTTDAEGRLTHYNQAAVDLFGRTPVLGSDTWCGSWKLFHGDGTPMPHHKCPMAVALKDGIIMSGAEAIAERPDGTRAWLTPYPTPLRNSAGELVGGINMVVDITERKQAEDALRRSAADLAEADRRKNEFLATLAHELRNPLAPIRNALEIMRLTPGDAKAAQMASEMMERQVRQMVRLVDDLLDVSRISRGRIELRVEPVELASVVQPAIEAARLLCDRKGIELSIALPPHSVVLSADSTRLAQVLGNLLNNACKFTNKGGRIDFSVARDNGDAVILVRDTGIGMDAEQLPRIFEMFVQVDTSLERSASGLGIGLTLVKDLVEQHGGTVRARSAGVGQGSEFEVRLPIATEMALLAQPSVSESPTTPSRRILVVDDNRDSAMSLAMLLDLAGNETRTAHDGLEAVEAAATFRPELVLLDIGLPKLNGYEAARRIREQPWGKGTVLVALTGWGQKEDRERSSEAGFNLHLVKPVDYAAITSLLVSVPSGLG